MKILLSLSLLFISCIVCKGQVECDSGYSYMPTICSSSLIIYADTCLPDSICKKLWREFNKNVCEETGMFIGIGVGYGSLYHSKDHKWDDIKGCIETEVFKVMKKNNWKKISKKKYDRLLKNKKSTNVNQ